MPDVTQILCGQHRDVEALFDRFDEATGDDQRNDHPHPNAPDTPPANWILGPVNGLVDRVRDALRRR